MGILPVELHESQGDDVGVIAPLDQRWQLQAACRGPAAALFFPPTSNERREERDERERRAKAICRGCPVMEQCREYALNIREPHGIWGGLNEVERRALLTQ
jgi:WhiB family redox-sensing transcriptional regulator